ncbi:hypothetical protein [Thermoplasma volcanium GSS1]|uniref:CRISPR system single-strand-specific deoxyribonuclease Cas10/Csm1 (subtype III-A) n=1 Tax=Thermoplasma volcanium (strain ATCC 51530 / DSM 4299 / JCM 9571 / NBRC 15438 / GSS1) TaxID=273116 RepID=Q97CJ0_THEVO|nr:type III-A CRISPR-associated protein Cas10/Csm1 [Thermoplasma volcanium]BAB59253.1 hypothetical protein [Thermoplasma volcanium GSS1]
MDNDEFVLITASILHDIGKIQQRYKLSEKHADLGYQFIKEIKYSNKDMERIANLVKHHHHDPDKTELDGRDKKLLKILQIADRKSAAHDREDRDLGEYRDIKLHKISNEIQIKDMKDTNCTYELKTLDDQENKAANSGYKYLYNKVKADIDKLNFNEPDKYKFFNTLNSILYKDTVAIPSAFYYSKPDIPLYHHLKLTAAIALSLYRNLKSSDIEISDDDKNPFFILLMCNLSGIQDYIFRHYKSEAADEKGTKRLKGRSFMIKLFTDSIESYIINEFNLYRFNVVWEKSDGFLLLMDNNEENIKKLEDIKKNIDLGLIEKKRGITANIAWVTASLDDFTTLAVNRNLELEGENDNFKVKMQCLYNNIDKAKRMKMSEIFSDNAIERDVKFGHSITNMCESCGMDSIYDNAKCIGCLEEENIGSSLYKYSNIITDIDNSYNADNRKNIILFHYGNKYIKYYFSDHEEKEVIKIYDYNNIDSNYNNWRFILQAKYVPLYDDVRSIKPFSDYFKDESEHKMLGVLKADVDDMGLIVAAGLKRTTISKLASLTFEFEYFFSVKLDEIAQQNKDIYIVYSGGDDVTAVGEINKLIKFISDFHNEFNKYFCKKINISAGVTVVSPKFPLRRAVLIAEENLKKAKENRTEKNSIRIFDTTMGWDTYDKMNEIGEYIYKKAYNNEEPNKNKLGKGFPYFLNNLGKAYNKRIEKGTEITDKIASGSVTIPCPMLYYYISRNYKSKDENEKKELINRLCEKDYENWKYMNYLSSYIVIKIRSGE